MSNNDHNNYVEITKSNIQQEKRMYNLL